MFNSLPKEVFNFDSSDSTVAGKVSVIDTGKRKEWLKWVTTFDIRLLLYAMEKHLSTDFCFFALMVLNVVLYLCYI